MPRLRRKASASESEPSPNGLVSKYREMANDADRERKAIEWSGALIGDETT